MPALNYMVYKILLVKQMILMGNSDLGHHVLVLAVYLVIL